MVSQKTDLKDSAMKTFLGPLHLDQHLHETIYVRPQTLFISLDDPAQGDFSNNSLLSGYEFHIKALIEDRPVIDAFVR